MSLREPDLAQMGGGATVLPVTTDPAALCAACGQRPRFANLTRCKSCLKASADADRQARAAAEARVAVKARAPIPEGFKYCKACNAIKPLGEFGQHHRAKDGKRKACRACVRKGRALTTPPTPEQAAQAKVAAAKPERRERNRQAVRSWAQRNPQAARARQILMRARRRGAVIPPAMCQVVDCENTRLVAHHSDYSRPLDVLHVCGRHHRLLHGGVALKLKEGVPSGLKRIPELGATPEAANPT